MNIQARITLGVVYVSFDLLIVYVSMPRSILTDCFFFPAMAAQETVHDDSTKDNTDNADNADNTGNKEKSPKKNRKRTRATRSSGPAPVVSPPLFSVTGDRETD